MAHLCPQRSTEFHAFGAASNPSSVQQHGECPESDESDQSNTNQDRTCRLFRGSNPNKLAESDESDRSDTKNDLSDCSAVGFPIRGHAADRGLPAGLVSAALGAMIVTYGLRQMFIMRELNDGR
jgi:hypothetical protein